MLRNSPPTLAFSLGTWVCGVSFSTILSLKSWTHNLDAAALQDCPKSRLIPFYFSFIGAPTVASPPEPQVT